jgi:hypothetical protein
MIDINPDCLLTHLRALAKFGADDHGVSGAGHAAMILARVMPAGMMSSRASAGAAIQARRTARRKISFSGCRVFAAAVDELISARSNAE